MKLLDKRIPPPLVALLAALAMWALSRYVQPFDLGPPLKWTISILCVLGAAWFGLSAIAAFRRARTTVNPHRPEASSALVTDGVYRLTRNPMYIGVMLLLIALAVWLAFPWSILCVLGFMLYLTCFQIVPEERALAARFGDDYRAYRDRVRRWF